MREPFARANVYLTALLVLEVLLGLAILIVSIVYQRILTSYMSQVECQMLSGQMFNIYIVGIELIVTYLASIGMWRHLWLEEGTPILKRMISMWLFFCMMISLCSFGTVWTFFTSSDAIVKSAEASLMKGIDMYYTCPEWKLLWDGLQYHKECCGVHSYKDWMKAHWMPNESASACGGGGAGGGASDSGDSDDHTILAPYACCRHDCTTCYENYIPRTGGVGSVPFLNMNQINENGCLPYFTKHMWQVMYTLIVLVLIAFKVGLFICCLAKFIVQCQCQDESEDNGAYVDDEQNIILVKCPPNTRCVTVDGDKEPARRGSHGGRGGYIQLRQEDNHSPSRGGTSRLCDCILSKNDSHIVH